MNVTEDKTKPPTYYGLAEKRAYMQGWRNARSGIPLSTNRADQPSVHKRWPQAYSRGYWEGYHKGPYDGCFLAYYGGPSQ